MKPNAKEVIFKTTGAVFTRQEIDAWEPMLTRAMKEYTSQVLDYTLKEYYTEMYSSMALGGDLKSISETILKIKNEL